MVRPNGLKESSWKMVVMRLNGKVMRSMPRRPLGLSRAKTPIKMGGRAYVRIEVSRDGGRVGFKRHFRCKIHRAWGQI